MSYADHFSSAAVVFSSRFHFVVLQQGIVPVPENDFVQAGYFQHHVVGGRKAYDYEGVI